MYVLRGVIAPHLGGVTDSRALRVCACICLCILKGLGVCVGVDVCSRVSLSLWVDLLVLFILYSPNCNSRFSFKPKRTGAAHG